MAELKTRPTDQSVSAFLERIEAPEKRQDCYTLAEMMGQITGEPPRMWGESIVGFGTYQYRYKSGRTAAWFLTGFAPRKRDLTLYIMSGFEGYDELLARLGKHKTGKACLYLKRLSQVDLDVLAELIARSVAHMRAHYPAQD